MTTQKMQQQEIIKTISQVLQQENSRVRNLPTFGGNLCNKINQQQFEVLIRQCYEIQVNSRYRCVEENSEIEKVFKKITKIIYNGGYKNSMLITGNIGSGKTSIALALNKILYCFGNFATYKNASDIIKDNFFDIVQSDILIIDDLGVEEIINDYGIKKNLISELLQKRYYEKKPTFITTNLSPSEIQEKYGVRILDRIKELYEIAIMKNPSFRK